MTAEPGGLAPEVGPRRWMNASACSTPSWTVRASRSRSRAVAPPAGGPTQLAWSLRATVGPVADAGTEQDEQPGVADRLGPADRPWRVRRGDHTRGEQATAPPEDDRDGDDRDALPDPRHGRHPFVDRLRRVDQAGGQHRGGGEHQLRHEDQHGCPPVALQDHRPAPGPARTAQAPRAGHRPVAGVPTAASARRQRTQDVDRTPQRGDDGGPATSRSPTPPAAPASWPPLVAGVRPGRGADGCGGGADDEPVRPRRRLGRRGRLGVRLGCARRGRRGPGLPLAAIWPWPGRRDQPFLHRGAVDVDVLLARQLHELVHDLVGDRPHDEAVVRQALVAGEVQRLADAHPDPTAASSCRGAAPCRCRSSRPGCTGTPVSSAIRATPVLPRYSRPSGERVPSG